MLKSEQWTRINQIYELVKQEGDANCEQAFDDLISEVNLLSRQARDLEHEIDNIGIVLCLRHQTEQQKNPDAFNKKMFVDQCWVCLKEALAEERKESAALMNQLCHAIPYAGPTDESSDGEYWPITYLKERLKELRAYADCHDELDPCRSCVVCLTKMHEHAVEKAEHYKKYAVHRLTPMCTFFAKPHDLSNKHCSCGLDKYELKGT